MHTPDLARAHAFALALGVTAIVMLPIDRAASVRASWREGRAETTAELPYGLAGDPFRLRGLVAVSVRP